MTCPLQSQGTCLAFNGAIATCHAGDMRSTEAFVCPDSRERLLCHRLDLGNDMECDVDEGRSTRALSGLVGCVPTGFGK